MTDDVQKTIITSLATAAPLMLMYWLNHRAMMAKIDGVKEDVKVIEKATNSMKDALVMVTEKEALGRGKAAGLLEGALQEKANPTGRPANPTAASVVPMMVMPVGQAPAPPHPVMGTWGSAGTPAKAEASDSSGTPLENAISDLTDAAKDTVDSAEKTVDQAVKIPKP